MSMELHTKILETQEQAVPYRIVAGAYDPQNPAAPVQVSLHLADGSKLGWMIYSVYKDYGCVQIRRLHNLSSFRHVEAALFEYAFRQSIEVGMHGKVELNSIEDTAGTFFSMGFRRQGTMVGIFSRLIQTYLSAPTPANKASILQEAEQSSYAYSCLVKEAAENLNKSETEITFEDVIHHGLSNRKANAAFEASLASRKVFKQLLNNYFHSPSLGLKKKIMEHPIYPKLISRAKDIKQKKGELAAPLEEISFEEALLYGHHDIGKPNEECYQLGMQGQMYLPDDIIAQKKIEFGITAPVVSREVKTSAVATPAPMKEIPSPPGITNLFATPVQQKSSPIASPASEETNRIMRLHTQILETQEQAVPYRIVAGAYDPKNPAAPVQVNLHLADGSMLGWMMYSVYKGCVEIRKLHNLYPSSFKYVGTALFEYAFRQSIKVGMQGRVELNATNNAPGAFFNMGFRRQGTMVGIFSRLIQTYLSAPTPANKASILQEAEQSSYAYSCLVKEAAENLNKSEDEITFEDVIHHGLSNRKADAAFGTLLASRKAFKQLLNRYFRSPSLGLKKEIMEHPIYPKLISQAKDIKQKKGELAAPLEEISFEEALLYGHHDIGKPNEECYQLGMQGQMYLPDDIIAQKKIEFGITAPVVSREVKTSAVATPAPTKKIPSPPGITNLFATPVQQKSSPISSAASILETKAEVPKEVGANTV